MNNLVFDGTHKDTIAELTSDLMDWLVQTTRIQGALGAARTPSGKRQAKDGKIGLLELQKSRHKNYM